MSLINRHLSALLIMGAALVSIDAKAQSMDSTMSTRPRVDVVQATDSAKSQTRSVRLVSRSTIPNNGHPLYLVDGKPIQEQELQLINPNDIESIDIVKGERAIALYGSRGANGVVLMTKKIPAKKPKHQSLIKKGRLN